MTQFSSFAFGQHVNPAATQRRKAKARAEDLAAQTHIVKDEASGGFYAGTIQGVVQWHQTDETAKRMRISRAYAVIADLNARDDESVYQLRAIEV